MCECINESYINYFSDTNKLVIMDDDDNLLDFFDARKPFKKVYLQVPQITNVPIILKIHSVSTGSANYGSSQERRI